MKYPYLIAGALALTLGGCASDGYNSRSSYDEPRYSQRCEHCGTVEEIDRVRYGERRRTTGGGAVIGALVGGAIGNQFGKGDGRRAATVAGAVIGGVAGNEIEKDRSRDDVYEISVRMDDGRRFVLAQYELNGIHEGSRVVVNEGYASLSDYDY